LEKEIDIIEEIKRVKESRRNNMNHAESLKENYIGLDLYSNLAVLLSVICGMP
jgi:hypothetical protein